MSWLNLWKLRFLWYLIYFFLAILFYHAYLFFFLIIDLHFSIPAVITQIFNPIAGLAIPIGITTNEAKSEV